MAERHVVVTLAGRDSPATGFTATQLPLHRKISRLRRSKQNEGLAKQPCCPYDWSDSQEHAHMRRVSDTAGHVFMIIFCVLRVNRLSWY